MGLSMLAQNPRCFIFVLFYLRGLGRSSQCLCPLKAPLTAINLSPASPSPYASVEGGNTVVYLHALKLIAFHLP